MNEKEPILRCKVCPKFIDNIENKGWLKRLLDTGKKLETNCEGGIDLVAYDSIQAFKGFVGREKLIETVCPKDITEAVIDDNKARVEKMDEAYSEVERVKALGDFDFLTGGLHSYFVKSDNTDIYDSRYK